MTNKKKISKIREIQSKPIKLIKKISINILISARQIDNKNTLSARVMITISQNSSTSKRILIKEKTK